MCRRSEAGPELGRAPVWGRASEEQVVGRGRREAGTAPSLLLKVTEVTGEMRLTGESDMVHACLSSFLVCLSLFS